MKFNDAFASVEAMGLIFFFSILILVGLDALWSWIISFF